MTAILFSGSIGPVPVDVIMQESHESELAITENPIETGAKITDHAYLEPKKITLTIAAQNAAETYNALEAFQRQREPFTYVSGLFVYETMLIKSLKAERDASTGRILSGTVELREVNLVETASTPGDESSKNNKNKGDEKNKSKTPSKDKAGDSTTAKRATGTTTRGDTPEHLTPTTSNKSILSGAW